MIELLFSYLVNIVSTHINFSFSAKWILSTYYIFFLSAASPGTVNKLSVMKIQTGLANTNMKLSVLFIVMQLLVLLAAQAIDLSPPPQQQQQRLQQQQQHRCGSQLKGAARRDGASIGQPVHQRLPRREGQPSAGSTG